MKLLDTPRGTRLQLSITAVFAVLILPALAAIIAFSYYANARNLANVAQRFIDRASDDATGMVSNLLDPVAATLRLVASVATARPEFFRSEDSRNVLYAALISAPQIDAVYTSFDDGYHRVVTRMDEDRRRSDPRIPSRANWHSSYIDDHTAGAQRARHRRFFEKWPEPIGGYTEESQFDVQVLPHYRAARLSAGLAISDPVINPDTGYPVISLAYPILIDERFVGAASANITLDILSKFLDAHRASPNSITLIADLSRNIIAHPAPAKGVRRLKERVELAKLSNLDEPQVVEAVRLRKALGTDRFSFELGSDSKEYAALFSTIPDRFLKEWEVIVVTPTDDFVGDLKETNRTLLWLMAVVVLLESLLIYIMARMISQPIEVVSGAIDRIRSLSFGQSPPANSRIREISHLQNATVLLENALRSFSVFVPVGLVRGLIASGKPLAPTVESRFMTIFFSDVENFTTISEQLSPKELSEQASRYFENVTVAVTEEEGTIDKFIGDSVMAFWGAPTELDDHVFRACVAALKASRRMKRLNAEWMKDGRAPMPIRIGLHCANVVVGNVGSPQRLSYTVMGDGVNIASRIEGLNKRFGTSICISDSVYEQVASRVVARPLQRLAVKGRRGQLLVYELFGLIGSTDADLKAEESDIVRCQMTSATMAHLTEGRFAEARDCYEKLLAQFPDDKVARLMRDDLVAAERGHGDAGTASTKNL
ncbi:MAG: adenylate/guanylate cyclase domain-containing protein [Reyranella sp.]